MRPVERMLPPRRSGRWVGLVGHAALTSFISVLAISTFVMLATASTGLIGTANATDQVDITTALPR